MPRWQALSAATYWRSCPVTLGSASELSRNWSGLLVRLRLQNLTLTCDGPQMVFSGGESATPIRPSTHPLHRPLLLRQAFATTPNENPMQQKCGTTQQTNRAQPPPQSAIANLFLFLFPLSDVALALLLR